MSENLHAKHRLRLKHRFLEEGLDNFEKHNILELLLFYSIPLKDTNELAHRLLNTFETIAGVFDAPYEELIKIKGVGENTAILLKLMPEIAKNYAISNQKGTFLTTSKDAGAYIMPYFIGEKNELVYAICLDAKGQVIRCECVKRGNFNSAEISVRELAKMVLKYNATGIILAHNHPSGLALPSDNDKATTITIKNGLQVLGVELYDHIIVADNDFLSFADTYHDWGR